MHASSQRRCSVALLWLLSGPALGQQTPPDLDALIAEALENEPSLQRMRDLADAASEVPSQVASLPDPGLTLAASNFRVDDPSLTTSPMTGIVVGVLQPIPYPGKLARRKQVAQSAEQLAHTGVLQRSTAVALSVQQRYWSLRYAEQAVRITEENASVLDGLTDIVTARFSVGQVAQQDALQVQVADSRLRAVLAEHRQNAMTAQRDLNVAVGRQPLADLAPTQPPSAPPDLDRDDLMRRLETNNPAVAIAVAQTALAASAVAEARAGLAPDFAVGADYRIRGATPGDASEGADMVSGSVRVFLPVWAASKQTARIREQRARLHAAESGQAAVLLEAQVQLARALDRLQRLDEQIELHTTQVVPQADQALSASIDDYSTGNVAFVSVLQNWTVSLQVQLALEGLLMQHAQTLALIDALVGGIEVTP